MSWSDVASPPALAVDRIVCRSLDPEQAARELARLAFLALIYLRGPHDAAMVAYQLADELADACR